MPALRKLVVSSAGFLVVATAAIGFLHTKPGRPLLMKLAGVAGCPMGKASPARVEEVRRAAVLRDRGPSPAPARPALGFALDATTIADVRAWAKGAGVDCAEEREGTLVQCADVPAVAVGRPSWEGKIAQVSFGFSPGGPLVDVAVLYNHRAAEESARIALEGKASLERDLGEPQINAGSFASTGTTATLSYRFHDYEANMTASKIPGSGYAVREQYGSAL
jgi:hypothetical protein